MRVLARPSHIALLNSGYASKSVRMLLFLVCVALVLLLIPKAQDKIPAIVRTGAPAEADDQLTSR